MRSLSTATLLFLPVVVMAIGENPIDINTLTGIIGGIGNMLKHDVETINVPAKYLMGRWFQMYKAAMNFDVFRTQMYCPVSYFKPNSVMGEDGFSIEEAHRVVSKTGPIETFKRDMNKVGAGQYWMYTEEYFYPRQFYIIHAGPVFDNSTVANDTAAANTKIDYFVVTDANRLALMVYARDPLTFYQKYNKDVMSYLEKEGFGGNVFWNSPRPIYQGPDCEWPSDREVFARRVIKNQQTAESARQNSTSSSENSIASPVAEIIQNPQLALQRLLQGQ